MNRKRLTIEELARRRKLRQRIRNGVGVTSDRAFTHVGAQPVEHRQTKALPSGAHIKTTYRADPADVDDLLREWGVGRKDQP